MDPRRTWRLIVALCALSVACMAAAQNYPRRPVRMIVGLPAGGSTDIMGRMLAAKLSERLAQQVVVDNRPGASGRTRAVNRVPACGM